VKILLTGYTGNLGFALANAWPQHRIVALVRNPESAPRLDHVEICAGALEHLPDSHTGEVEAIVHCAASTAFRAPLDELRQTNVEGTARLLAWAKNCPRLERFLQVSTVCVAGEQTGLIAEAAIPSAPPFTNAYEQSKWEAEQAVLGSALPVEIVRVSTVTGSEDDGSVRRLGAIHQLVYWLMRGLVPMMPGEASAPVDFISTGSAVRVLSQVIHTPVSPGRIVHAAAGTSAPALGEVLDHLRAIFSRHLPAWARGVIALPDFADAPTWSRFAASAEQSGDLLFRRIVADAQSFLPALLHPRRYATSLPSEGDWRTLLTRNVEWLLRHQWRPAHAN